MNDITLAIGHLAHTPRQFALLNDIYAAGDGGVHSPKSYSAALAQLRNEYQDCTQPPLLGLVETLSCYGARLNSLPVNPMIHYARDSFAALSLTPTFWTSSSTPEVQVPPELLRTPENTWLGVYVQRFKRAVTPDINARKLFAMTSPKAYGISDEQVADLVEHHIAAAKDDVPFLDTIKAYQSSLGVFTGQSFNQDVEDTLLLTLKQHPGIGFNGFRAAYERHYPIHPLTEGRLVHALSQIYFNH